MPDKTLTYVYLVAEYYDGSEIIEGFHAIYRKKEDAEYDAKLINETRAEFEEKMEVFQFRLY